MRWRVLACSLALTLACAAPPVFAAAPANQAEWTQAVQRRMISSFKFPPEAQRLSGPISLSLKIIVRRDGSLLPVEVRSNAGTVSITAQATVPLSSGTFQIPLSEVIVTSSDPGNLPAPAIPDTGSGAAVTVATGGTGTGAAPTLLTYRTATWRFRYTPVTAPVAGAYTGQITFTATAP